MTTKIPPRLSWAVDVLAVQADDKILEIGCGQGISVSLICEKLVSGKIIAIDRSEKMIDIAENKNQSCITSGRAAFYTTALDKADFDGLQFNKIFAVNVNVFWLNPARELKIIKELLTPEGILYLFYEPPTASKLEEIADKTRIKLQENGFSIREVLFSKTCVCIMVSP